GSPHTGDGNPPRARRPRDAPPLCQSRSGRTASRRGFRPGGLAMNVDELVTYYVAFRQTLGEKCKTIESILRAFCRAAGPQTPVAHIGAGAVSAFLDGRGPVTSGWFGRHRALKGFFRFAISRGHLTEAPLPKALPKPPPPFVPYIYTRGEIRRLLDAIEPSQDYRTLVEPHALRAILLLLYGAGLRVGEALTLT